MDERNKGLIPDEDLEYERDAAEAAREESERLAEQEQRYEQQRQEFRNNRAKELNDSKIELMKLRQGIIESSETIREEEKVEYKQTFGEWLSNVWYRSKWLIIFVVIVVAAFSYITYDSVTKTKPDMTVLVLSSNYGLYYRTEEIEAFLANYCEDLNGDGKVYVQVYNISTDYSDTNTVTANQAQLMSQLQSGDNIILIADSQTDFAMHDFTDELQLDICDERGVRLSCELVREALKWEAMPEDIYIGMREPAALFSTSYEAMQANFDEARPLFDKIVEAIVQSEP